MRRIFVSNGRVIVHAIDLAFNFLYSSIRAIQVPSNASLAIRFFLMILEPVSFYSINWICQVDDVSGAVRFTGAISVQVMTPFHHIIQVIVILGHMAEISCL